MKKLSETCHFFDLLFFFLYIIKICRKLSRLYCRLFQTIRQYNLTTIRLYLYLSRRSLQCLVVNGFIERCKISGQSLQLDLICGRYIQWQKSKHILGRFVRRRRHAACWFKSLIICRGENFSWPTSHVSYVIKLASQKWTVAPASFSC